ncbi:MAG: GWxTD domain-containing protein, partial [candidate division Zixibacteria bacterium]|nr:GWxTD domain-containing protein [candidate division Zixibacteria bacterium]
KLQLRKAIELNPIDETPHLLLFNIFASRYYVNGWQSEAVQAESTMQALLRQVPSSPNGLCKLASLEAVRGGLSLALEHAQRALALDSAAVDINLVLGYIEYQLRHYEPCQHHYDKALAGMNRFDRLAYTTVEAVLPPQVAAEYPNWRPAVRDSISRDFWRTRDSDPTTEINERELEHYSRVWEANLYFGTPENGGVGWRTAMGATLVRMGRPDGRRRALVEVHWSLNKHFIDESPVWYWNYGSTEIPCSFAFLDRYMNNKYTYPAAGYDNRLPPLYQESRRLAEAIFNQKPEQSSLLRFRQPVNIGSEIYQFRGAAGRTVALVHLTIPCRDIAFDTVGDRAKATLAVRKALRTPDQEMIWHKAEDEKLDLSIGEARLGSGSWMDLFTVEAKPGVYQLAVACEQPQANHFSLCKNSVKLQSYDSAVALSDLLLTAASIADPKLGDIWKGGNSGKVFPQRTLPLSKPLTVYFEIYNLPTDIYAQTSLQISYSLRLIRTS